MVADERGRAVPVVRELQSLPGPVAVWRKRVALPRSLRRSVITTWFMIGYLGAIWAFPAVGVFTALAGIGVMFGDLLRLPEFRAWVLVWMCAPAMLLMAVQASWAWSGRHKASRFMAARGCCPSCGVSLLGTTEDANGLAMCVKCRAAWKLGSPEKCPRCAYDLAGAVGVDGVITCPECADTWPAATERRSRHEALAEHGSMLDDAGERAANRSNTKSRRIALRARSKDERERAGLANWLLSMGFILCFMLLPALCGASLFWLADRYLSETTADFTGAMLGYAIAGGLLFFGAKMARRSRLNTCRRLAICPACDADLRGVAPRGDGLTTCPNCDAKWKLPVRSAAGVA